MPLVRSGLALGAQIINVAALMAAAFTPKQMRRIEDQIRANATKVVDNLIAKTRESDDGWGGGPDSDEPGALQGSLTERVDPPA